MRRKWTIACAVLFLFYLGHGTCIAREATRKMTLHVLDSESGEPITNAFVRFKRPDKSRETETIRADSRGEWFYVFFSLVFVRQDTCNE